MVEFIFGLRSLKNLVGVHPDLVRVVERGLVLSPIDFAITDGIRTSSEQSELVRVGKSKTLNSRHLTGHAVDVAAYVNGTLTWDWECYELIAVAMKTASKQLTIPIDWGGDWAGFRDGVHFQLTRKGHPA